MNNIDIEEGMRYQMKNDKYYNKTVSGKRTAVYFIRERNFSKDNVNVIEQNEKITTDVWIKFLVFNFNFVILTD